MWLPGLHLVCMESTLHRPSSSLRVSAECKSCLLWIFPRMLQLLFMLCCCFPQAQHQHAAHLSSVMAAGAPLQVASLTSSPTTTYGIHPPANSSIWCDMIAQPFMHEIMTPSWSFPKQEMKSSYMRNFLAVILSPLFSCKWRNKQKLHLTIAKHQHCCYTVNFSNNKVQSTHNNNNQVMCVIEKVIPDVLK